MEILYFLESIRNPFLDSVVALLTELGGEVVFLAVGLLLLWCVNKRHGYFMLTVCYSGIILSQFLKILCRIPRPWVKDPAFTIVESAREAATGYSFPSGHTTNMSCTAGSIAWMTQKRWLKWTCVALIVFVAFSRMYLGVHTPLDVSVAIGMSALLVLLVGRLYEKIDKNPRLMYAVFAGVLATTIVDTAYTFMWPFPADVDAANLASARQNACSLLGAALGLVAGYAIDKKYVNYDVKAVWWAQIIKYAIGLALLLAIKSLLKTPLNAVLGENIGRIARYFLMLLFTGAIWPMTFGFFARLGGKKHEY